LCVLFTFAAPDLVDDLYLTAYAVKPLDGMAA
jgi:hypothetical protein